MGYLIDSDVLIEMERGNFPFQKLVKGKEDEELFLSVISASELLHGVNRAKKPENRMKRSSFVEALLDSIPTLTIDLPVARIHSKLCAEINKNKVPIEIHDTWIAASCIANGLTLITRNKRHFEKIPGLSFETIE